MPEMLEYRHPETRHKWLVGAGWSINLERGQAYRGTDTRGLRYDFAKRQVSDFEIEACELGLTASERKVYVRLREEGKTVLRAGWPDLLVIDGDETYGVEIKTPVDKVSPRQLAMHKALEKAGIRVEVEIVR